MTLEELRKEPHLSASSINEYLGCGLLFKLRRIDRLHSEGKSDSLEFGSAIHLVLGEYYQSRMAGKKLTLKKVHSLFTKYWKEAAAEDDEIQYQEGKSYESLLNEGKALLSAYFESLSGDEFKVLAIEKPFRLDIDGIPVIGAVDLLEEDESGTIIITDFKTSGRAYGDDEIDRNLQLSIYHMAMKANGYSDREILLRIDCLIKAKKKPRFETYYTSRSEADERRVVKKVLHVWEGIQKGVFLPNDTGWRCKWCDLKSYCDEYLES